MCYICLKIKVADVYCCSCLLQEKDLVKRYAEATAENNQRQKQMDLAKNLILQVRKQALDKKCSILWWPLYYKICSPSN